MGAMYPVGVRIVLEETPRLDLLLKILHLKQLVINRCQFEMLLRVRSFRVRLMKQL